MKLRIIIWLLALTGLMTGCLDEDLKDQIYETDIYHNSNDVYVNAVAVLYNYIGGDEDSEGLQGTCRGVYDYNTLTTDEAMIPVRGGNWYDGGLWQNMYRHSWSSADLSLYNTWKYLYKVVVLANKSLATIDTYSHLLSQEEKTAYQAEVRAIRAMFYYYIQDMFGSVPLVTEYPTPQKQMAQCQRSEICRFIIHELQEVAPLLADEHSNLMNRYYGRITAPVAYFLLAKMTLNAEVYMDDNWTDGERPDGRDIVIRVDGQPMNTWEACIHYCDLITASNYRLAQDYQSNFAVHNENSPENIFIIPLDKTLYTAQLQYLFRSRHYCHGSALGGSSENGTCATISTVKTYGYGTDHTDARFPWNFYAGQVVVDGKTVKMDNGQPLEYLPFELKPDLTGSPYEETAGARMAKYEVDRTAYSDGRQPDNDIVLFRYADVLLMKAEALVRDGKDGSAELNAVRARAGMPAKEATLDNILDERLLELVWEGWRRQDLIRYNRFHKAYDQRTPLPMEMTGYTTVFPIPKKCIDLNAQLKQHVGYK